MLQRCSNPKDGAYGRYGGRGISVCERWRKFENFRDDMGYPLPRHSLDRIDVNGDYGPSNCRWATTSEQARNTRRSIKVQVHGVEMVLRDACDLLDLNYGVIRSRIRDRGWPPQVALDTPTDQARGMHRKPELTP